MSFANIVNAAWRLGLKVAYRAQLIYWLCRRPTVTGVYVAVWHAGRLLIIQNSYKTYRTIPCGLPRRREQLKDSAARELREEAGIDLDPRDLRFATDFVIYQDCKQDHVHFFEVELADEPPIVVDGREVIWGAFEKPEQALSHRLSPAVREYLQRRESDV